MRVHVTAVKEAYRCISDIVAVTLGDTEIEQILVWIDSV